MLVNPNQPVERSPSGATRISATDSTELRWYFSDPQIAGVGTGSNMGLMLERAALMAISLAPCKRCGGSIEEGRAGTGYCARGGGSYEKALERYRKELAKKHGLRYCPSAEVASEWRRLGIQKVASPEELAEELPPELTKRCLKCEGTGMVQRRRNGHTGPQTVKATGSSVVGNPDAMHWVDEQGLARYASVGRKLDRVAKRSGIARAALAVYYAPNGGSVGSLWRLVPSGRRFLETTPNPRGLSPEQLMQNEREANRATPVPERTALFSAIARECAELWEMTCAAWLEGADE